MQLIGAFKPTVTFIHLTVYGRRGKHFTVLFSDDVVVFIEFYTIVGFDEKQQTAILET